MAKYESAKRRSARAAVTDEIAVALAKKRMKWKDIAWILGISHATVSYKKANHTWTLKDLVAISDALNTSFVIGGTK